MAKAKTAKTKTVKKTTVVKFAETAKITVLAKENPKRAGSKAEKRFRFYKTGQTVEAALKAGVLRRDLLWDEAHGLIRVGSR